MRNFLENPSVSIYTKVDLVREIFPKDDARRRRLIRAVRQTVAEASFEAWWIDSMVLPRLADEGDEETFESQPPDEYFRELNDEATDSLLQGLTDAVNENGDYFR